MGIDISLVIPVYNEKDSLRILYDKILPVLQRINRTWEIIFVDDGSSDGSTQILKDLQAEDSGVVLAVQRRNFGKSAALMMGFELALGDTIITMDSDLQDDPEEIPNLLAKIDEGLRHCHGLEARTTRPLIQAYSIKNCEFRYEFINGTCSQ